MKVNAGDNLVFIEDGKRIYISTEFQISTTSNYEVWWNDVKDEKF